MFLSSFKAVILAVGLMEIAAEFQLEEDHCYAIQSVSDNSYLKMLNNSHTDIECGGLGDVITTKDYDLMSTLIKWQYVPLYNNDSSSTILFSDADYDNEISMGIEMRKPPPHEWSWLPTILPACYHIHRIHNLTQITENTFTIENLGNHQCLTHIRLEQRISWENCDSAEKSAKNQLWNFIDLGKEEVQV